MENIKNYLMENEKELINVVGDLNAYNGCFENVEAFNNDCEFFNIFFNEDSPYRLVEALSYGSYSISDDYVRFDGCGNLESLSKKDYIEELQSYMDDIVENLIENYYHIQIDGELLELINEYENKEEEE